MVSLNVVAHPDDDLLFLNPDILSDLEEWGIAHVVYMTWGDDGYADDYVDRKRNAVRNAYNNGLGFYFYRDVHVRSNSFRTGDIYGDLYKMWHSPTFETKSFYGQTLYKSLIVDTLQAFIEQSHCEIIRTHDPDAAPAIDHDEPHLDHIDHIYTARFVQEAAKSFPNIPVYAYEGYPIRHKASNVEPEMASKKLEMWRRYQEIDTSVAGEQWDIAANRCYKRQVQ